MEDQEDEVSDLGYEDEEYAEELMDYSYDDEELCDSTDAPDMSEYSEELMDFSYEKTEAHNSSGGKVEGPAVPEKAEYTKSDGSVDWDKNGVNSDKDGFDSTKEIEDVTLNVGDTFIRYGNSRGHFGTTPGTEYNDVSLPYKEDSVEFHTYRVVSPISCKRGTVAQNFEKNGGGTQYMFSNTIRSMEQCGMIVEVK